MNSSLHSMSLSGHQSPPQVLTFDAITTDFMDRFKGAHSGDNKREFLVHFLVSRRESVLCLVEKLIPTVHTVTERAGRRGSNSRPSYLARFSARFEFKGAKNGLNN
jgi:hypothetical protein